MSEKIERTFVREEVYLRLRDSIVDGTFTPGLQLRDKELAEKLGISRTPVREALLRLEDEGLVITKPNRSTLVCPIDFHDAFHLYSLVWSLEKLALSQSFAVITDRHIEQMSETNELFLQKLQTKDRLSALNADYDFHSVYVKLSQNRALEQILSELKYKLKRLDLYYFANAQGTDLSYEEHLHIIEALKRKDLPSALDAVEGNWKAAFSRMKNKDPYVSQ